MSLSSSLGQSVVRESASYAAPSLDVPFENLSDLFARSIAYFQDHVALRYRNEALTYGELGAKASQFARYLRARGVGPGDFVGVFMPRGLDMHVVILGILQSGAAYVPMDTRCPLDRVDFIVRDCAAKFLVTDSSMVPEDAAWPLIFYDREMADIAAMPTWWLSTLETRLASSSLAYVIYTSGTTGRPKGVMINHASICHLIRSESSVLELNDDDIVLQGFSLSFDMSLEETWTAYFVGATLVVASSDMMNSGPDLASILADLRITVWHCVPSLLAVQEEDIPSLRLLNLGGEACPPELARRWHRPGRRILNTYGPTETTVTATFAELTPGGQVTIGKPLPGYRVYILDENLMPVAEGAEGELAISGPGLAVGYLNLPEMTRAKFVRAPFVHGDEKEGVLLYRSGDTVRRNDDGNIEFINRRDGQVKIRGFRVELGELEAILMEEDGVQLAAAALVKDPSGMDALVACVVMRHGASFDEDQAWRHLKARLPPYMLPAVISVVDSLPHLPSGKVDRSQMNFPKELAPAARELALPQTALEERIHDTWSTLFAPFCVGVDDDFFADLGGHSLKAAQLISKLRRTSGLEGSSISDLYHAPTIRQLAKRLEAQSAASTVTTTPQEAFQKVPQRRYVLCAVAQALALIVLFGCVAGFWALPLATYFGVMARGAAIWPAMAAAFAVSWIAIPLFIALAIATKWIVIGRYREGDYPLWGSYYFRWWFVRRVLAMVPEQLMMGTPFMTLYLRLLGARIGRNVHLAGGKFDAADLVAIGSSSAISSGATLSCCSVERGVLRIRPVSVGERCYVGHNAAVGPGAKLEDDAALDELSALSPATTIPKGQLWAGSPARLRSRHEATRALERLYSPTSTLLLALAAMALPIVAILPVLPTLSWLLHAGWLEEPLPFLFISPVLATVIVLLTCLQVAFFKWLLLGRVKAESIPLTRGKYARYWFVERLMGMNLATMRPLYASLYVVPWYRLLGIKVGKRAEVSTASSVAWDLLELSDECFVADGVTLGAPRVINGQVELQPTYIGQRTFLGNSALVPGGVTTGDQVLIGCLSVPPAQEGERKRSAASWFGSPAIFLPQREQVGSFDESVTFRPGPGLYATRLAIEGMRIILPITCDLVMLSALMFTLDSLRHQGMSWWQFTLMLPFFYLALCLAATLLTVVLKAIVVGRYVPIVRPLWSHFVWRSEAVTCYYESLICPLFLQHLRGTPFINVVLRWMGCKIGRRVFTDTTDITEHDVVSVGDDVALNEDCGLQTHLFEDRVMKVSHVTIGDRCTVGANSIILYDSVMEDDAQLADLSLLMKAETLPPASNWEGSPAVRAL